MNLVPVSQCRHGERATHLVEDDDRYDASTYRAICGRTIRANGANWSPDQTLVCGTCIRAENVREAQGEE